MTVGKCIYCYAEIEIERGEGDHIINQSLGKFDGKLIFRRICRTCNSRVGKCEEQILRCAPEAYLRRVVDPVIERDYRGTKMVGAAGAPPPKFIVRNENGTELSRSAKELLRDGQIG